MDRSELHNLDLRLVHDAHAPLGSLPRILGLLPEQVAHRSKPYFKSDPLKREIFSNQVNIDGSKITCGIAWSSKNQKIGVHKSMALSQWAPVLQNTQVEFVNLQYGDVDEEIKNVQAELGRTIRQVPGLDVHRDIDGLIALIDACDVVITTSNVTAHLAGALGKTGALLVPHAQGKIWYWHLEDARSMWYPSLQMFRLGPTPNVQPIMLEINQWLLGIVQSCGLRSNQS
jgi:ADP-heptose:LPS heptosyltransferase